MNYVVLTDATCDMNLDILQAKDIHVIGMEITFDDERSFVHYPDFRNFASKDFYQELENGHNAKSTQINPTQYEVFFEQFLKEGKDILYICLSSGLSSTYVSSTLAISALQEKYPDRKMLSLDSLAASSGEGLLAILASDNRQKGMSIEENYAWLQDHRNTICHLCMFDELTYLYRGGRISKTTAVIGDAINLKPIIYLTEEGKLTILTTAHGVKNREKKILKMIENTIEDKENQVIYIGQADCLESAMKLRQTLIDHQLCKDAIITNIGPVIGTHTGPTALCVFFVGKHKKPIL